MNVIREDVDALNAVLKVKVAKEDYQEKVKTTLDKYRKTAKIPGFRPGHIPFAMIEKQYGPSVVADELNKTVNEALYSYIQDNNLNILGNPIPKEDAEVVGDFKNPGDFEFVYSIGLSPEINVSLSGKNKFDYMKVKVDEKLIGKQVEDLRRRYGKLSSADEVAEGDMILAQFVELDENGAIKEGGVLHSSTVSMEFIEDKNVKKELTGKKVGEKVVVDPVKVSRGDKDMAAMLGVDADKLADLSNKFQLTINDIKRMELAELNQELFDKLFGEGEVKSEADLKKRVAADLSEMFADDSDRLLTRSVYDTLIEKTDVKLPDDFLKNWIRLSNEKPISKEQIEAEYDGYAKGLKWQLIQNNIFKANDIKLDGEEAVAFTKDLLVKNYAQYGLPAPGDEELTTSARQVLSNKEEANRIYDMLAESKLTEFFKNTVKLNEKEVSYDEFVALASK